MHSSGAGATDKRTGLGMKRGGGERRWGLKNKFVGWICSYFL